MFISLNTSYIIAWNKDKNPESDIKGTELVTSHEIKGEKKCVLLFGSFKSGLPVVELLFFYCHIRTAFFTSKMKRADVKAFSNS